MLPISAKEQALINYHVTELARLMHKNTEPSKLETFESIEVEVRNQIQEIVAPSIGDFFCPMGEKNVQGKSEK